MPDYGVRGYAISTGPGQRANVASSVLKEALYLGAAHRVEIVWNRDLTSHESETLSLCGIRCIDRHDFDQRLSCLGDDEGLAFCRLVDKPGELGLGFVNVVAVRCLALPLVKSGGLSSGAVMGCG